MRSGKVSELRSSSRDKCWAKINLDNKTSVIGLRVGLSSKLSLVKRAKNWAKQQSNTKLKSKTHHPGGKCFISRGPLPSFFTRKSDTPCQRDGKETPLGDQEEKNSVWLRLTKKKKSQNVPRHHFWKAESAEINIWRKRPGVSILFSKSFEKGHSLFHWSKSNSPH